ncbi:MAG TPA: DUF2330 domain-containing protein, partial [Polyangiaceae bacterium]|nr:DUF2330 domain-containing protein [Polyangiaceae bacterium]
SQDAEDPAALALEWLADNDYDVSLLGEDILASYLEEGLNLAAFRLTKNSNAGSIRPVLIKYQSDQPVIPIRPTAVAANPDMGILVWVLGPGRAVPVNYRSLVLNDALLNWFNPSSNYNDVVIAAADEAGGHGFVTELATGETDTEPVELPWENTIYPGFERDFRSQLDELGLQPMLTFASERFGTWDGFREALEGSVALRDGVTFDDFLECVDCYFVAAGGEVQQSSDGGPMLSPIDGGSDAGLATDAGPPPPSNGDPIWATDPAAFLELLDSLVLEPMASTAALFPGQTVTRLYTTLSADEMDEDPVFDFNLSLPGLSNNHQADQYLECDGSWVIELPSGLVIQGDGSTWPVSMADDLPYNLQVIQDDVEGPGDVITDNLELISSALSELGVLGEPVVVNSPDAGSGDITYVNDDGCGCRVVGRDNATTPWWMIALGAGFLLRRKRRG